MNKKFVTISTYPEAKRILKRVAEIKRWKLSTLLSYFAHMFAVSMELLIDPIADVEDLREAYEDWEIAILPELRED